MTEQSRKRWSDLLVPAGRGRVLYVNAPVSLDRMPLNRPLLAVALLASVATFRETNKNRIERRDLPLVIEAVEA